MKTTKRKHRTVTEVGRSVTTDQAIELLQSGKIVTVTFVKRGNGELRKMVCRSGVKKHLKGGVQPYVPAFKALQTVYDLQKGEYRNVSLERIRTITSGGKIHRVVFDGQAIVENAVKKLIELSGK